MDFKHGQPAQVVDTKRPQDLVFCSSYGRLYRSTVRGEPAYIWLVGTEIQLPIEGPNAVVVDLANEVALLINRNKPQFVTEIPQTTLGDDIA